jgi:uncharacterized membrane protein SpoIIM required for sporulation
VIIDLRRFIEEEEHYWEELASVLDRQDADPLRRLTLSEVKRLLYLYRRTSAGLAKVAGFSAETDIRRYLESLVARAYAQVHEVRGDAHRFRPLRWFFEVFPATFRNHGYAFLLSLAITLFGCAVGAIVLSVDKEAKRVIMPFSHLQTDPAQRVAHEEKDGAARDRMEGVKTTFSAYLMTHNTRVSLFTFALGLTWGVGTAIFLFSNGIMLGAVALDYVTAGQTTFLLGWLLPHGVVEIPAILVAGQAGFVLAGAIIGRGARVSTKARLRKAAPDVITLVAGLIVMLVWAGLVEAFFSQYHEPVLPYGVKIGFGVLELSALVLFFGLSGRQKEADRGKGE